MEVLQVGLIKMYINKELGNLYVGDKKSGESKSIKYGLYGADNELIGLRDYINIRNIDIKEAIDELEGCNAVLIGPTFNITFYTEEDKDMFSSLLKV